VILEEAPAVEPLSETPGSNGAPTAAADQAGVLLEGGLLRAGTLPWMLSGESEEALRAQAERLREYLNGDTELQVTDLGFSLSTRSAFGQRAVILGGEREELLSGLSALAAGEQAAGVIEGVASPAVNAGAVFMFPGQAPSGRGWRLSCWTPRPAVAERMRATGRGAFRTTSTGPLRMCCGVRRALRGLIGWTWSSRRCSR